MKIRGQGELKREREIGRKRETERENSFTLYQQKHFYVTIKTLPSRVSDLQK